MTTPHSAPDRRWQQVTCSDCGRTYQCVPLDDFYAEQEDGTGGCCFTCLLARNGLEAVDG